MGKALRLSTAYATQSRTDPDPGPRFRERIAKNMDVDVGSHPQRGWNVCGPRIAVSYANRNVSTIGVSGILLLVPCDSMHRCHR
jgi:hypothetical protein